MRLEGVLPGVSDVVVLTPSMVYHGLVLEFKQPGNKPTPDQYTFITRCRLNGYCAQWATSVEDALELLRRYFADDIIPN